MNHQLWKAVGARVLAMAFLIAGAAACGERISNTASGTPKAVAPSPSAVVIGQAPAEPAPSTDTAQCTPPAGAQGEVSKAAENVARPIEGDNHSHSTLAPTTPQKADGVNRTGANETPARTQ